MDDLQCDSKWAKLGKILLAVTHISMILFITYLFFCLIIISVVIYWTCSLNF